MPIQTALDSISQNQGSPFGFKNRIINGAMVIDQRNGGSSGTASTYTVDRFGYYATQSSKGTWQQNAGSVTPPAGFTNYLGFTSSSSYSVTSSDFFEFYQQIEGYNIADLAWGTTNAKPVTLSFWVRSSLTGSFGGFLTNSANNRIYPFSYTISSANTWTYISITIPGETTGTWATNNTLGIQVGFGLGAGSNFNATAGAWTSTANNYIPTSSVSVVGTNGATWYITGVQLEVGRQASSFDWRPYTIELQLCQRYYWQIYSAGTTEFFIQGYMYNTTQLEGIVQFPVPMRTMPTLTTSAMNQFQLRMQGGNPGSINAYYVAKGNGPYREMLIYTASNSATLTAGYASSLVSSGATVTTMNFNAEL